VKGWHFCNFVFVFYGTCQSVVLVCVLAHRAICGQTQVAEEARLHCDRTLSPHDDHTDELFEPFGVVLPITAVSGLVHILALQKVIEGSREAGTHGNYFLI
jgi:hypothetical protein